MEKTTELRSKEEITRDIEATRAEVKNVLRQTRRATKGPNAAKRAWAKTKDAAAKTKETIVRTSETAVEKTKAADRAIRGNIYSSLGVAAAVGAAAGFVVRKKIRRRRAG